MLQKLFQSLLRKYLGEFVAGIENVELAFWTGKIHLQNTALKQEKVNEILRTRNIALDLKYSSIGSLQIDIPWNKLSSAPVEIKVSGIFMVLKILKVKNVDAKIEEDKIALLKNYVEHLIKKAMEDKLAADESGGFIKKIIAKIINNLNLSISNISLRLFRDVADDQEMYSQQERDTSMLSDRSSSKNSLQPAQGGKQTNNFGMRSSSPQKSKPEMAFGLCIERLSSETVDEQNNKTFYNIENEKSMVRKVIKLKNISLYLQKEQYKFFKIDQEAKNRILESLVYQHQNKILTIDGEAILYRNKGAIDYDFDMKLKQLRVSLTYQQLQEIVKILTNFFNNSESKKIGKLLELKEDEQLKLKEVFMKKFEQLYQQSFHNQDEEMGHILRSVSNMNLLEWSKNASKGIIKQIKIGNAKKIKNKRGWFSFMASQVEIQLTQLQLRQIETEIEDIISDLSLTKKTNISLALFFNQISGEIIHLAMQQFLKLELINTQINYQYAEQTTKIQAYLSDTTLLFEDRKQKSMTPIFRKAPINQIEDPINSSDNEYEQYFCALRLLQTSKNKDISLSVKPIEINHETQIFLLANQLMKLQQKQKLGSDIAIKKVQLSSQKIENIKFKKQFKINIQFDTIQFNIQVSKSSNIVAVVQRMEMKTNSQGIHMGQVCNMRIYFERKQLLHPILNQLSINFTVSNVLDQIRTEIEELSLVLSEEDLSHIYKNFKKQLQTLNAHKVSHKNKRISQNTYIQGNLKTLTIFKNWQQYYAKVNEDSIYFYDSDHQAFEFQTQEVEQYQKQEKPIYVIPLRNATVILVSENRFKIESSQINELIECDNETLETWVAIIQRVIFECSPQSTKYNIIDQQPENRQIKHLHYETQFSCLIHTLTVFYKENNTKPIIQMQMNEINITLQENEIEYTREIYISDFYIKNCMNDVSSEFVNLISSKQQTQDVKEKYKVYFQGKKKTHPQYKGQTEISSYVPFLQVNYDAEFIYFLISKIAWTVQVPIYLPDTRDNKVVEFISEYLLSKKYDDLNKKLKNAQSMQSHAEFMDFDIFKKSHSTSVIMEIKVDLKFLELNLLNGRTHMCLFNAQCENIKLKVNKGNNFLFIKASATNLSIFDVTGYPNTNNKPWEKAKPYAMLHKSSTKSQQQCISGSFSTFSVDSFLNKDRIKSFLGFQISDFVLNYQNQPLNRFFDFLLNQIVEFLNAPHSLHKFDSPSRGFFQFRNHSNMTEKQVKQVIRNSFHPFFNKLIIKAHNLTVVFNSHPCQQGVPFRIQTVSFESRNLVNSDRIKFKITQLKKMEKNAVFASLIEKPEFQNQCLKSHWGTRFEIVAAGCRADIIDSQGFEFLMTIDRVYNAEKGIILPCVQVDQSIICKSQISQLNLLATKKTYNLINRCFLHNLSYDDQKDSLFVTNNEFKHFMTVSELFYSLEVKSLSIKIPDQDSEMTICIPEFEYIFVRHPSMVKQMFVKGRIFSIYDRQTSLIRPRDHAQTSQFRSSTISPTAQQTGQNKLQHPTIEHEKAFHYSIEMRTDGSKVMTADLQSVQICYDLKKFIGLLQYFLLDQSCYPAPIDLNDLPLIVCTVHLKDVYVKLLEFNSQIHKERISSKGSSYLSNNLGQAKLNDVEYVGNGDIDVVWTRNQLIHPEKYERDCTLFPDGQQWCNYVIKLKKFALRRYANEMQPKNTTNLLYKFMTEQTENPLSDSRSSHNHKNEYKQQLNNYRALSDPIFLDVKISQLMRISTYGDKYNDNIFTVFIKCLPIKFCYSDVEQFRNNFGKKQQPKQKQPQIQELRSENVDRSRKKKLSKIDEPSSPSTAPNFHPLTQYNIEIAKISIRMGLSELPIPILDLIIGKTMLSMEMLASTTNVVLKTNVLALYWNMQIGRWEGFIERLISSINVRIGKPNKYITLDCDDVVNVNMSIEAMKVISLLLSDVKQRGELTIMKTYQNQNPNSIRPKGFNVSPYILTNKTGHCILVNNDLISNAKLQSDEKMYIDLKSFDISHEQVRKVGFKFDHESYMRDHNIEHVDKEHEETVQLNLGVTKRSSIKFLNNRIYPIYLKVVSSAIMKEIIISSCYQIQNKTQHLFIFRYAHEAIKVNPAEKLALKLDAKLNGNISIQFPYLQYSDEKSSIQIKDSLDQSELHEQVKSQCPFPFDIIANGYEHSFLSRENKSFNCILSLDESPETVIAVEPTFYIKNLLPFDLPVQFLIVEDEETDNKRIHSYELQVNQQKHIYEFGNSFDLIAQPKKGHDRIKVRVKVPGFNMSAFQSIAQPNNRFEYINSIELVDYSANFGYINIKILKDGKARRIYFYCDAIIINETKSINLLVFNQDKLIPGQQISNPNIAQLQSPYVLINEEYLSSKMISFSFSQTRTSSSDSISVVEPGRQEVNLSRNHQLHELVIINTFTCLDNVGKVYSNILKVQPKYIIYNRTTHTLQLIQNNIHSRSYFLLPNERMNWIWPAKNAQKQLQLKICDEQQVGQCWQYCFPINIQDFEEIAIVIRTKAEKSCKKILRISPIREHQSTFIVVKEVENREDSLIIIKNELRFCKLHAYQEAITKQGPILSGDKCFEIQPCTTQAFGWDYPLQPQKIVLIITFLNYLQLKFNPIELTIDIQNQGTYHVESENANKQSYEINAKVEIIGLQKILLIEKRENNDESESQSEMMHFGDKIGFSFSYVGISFIGGLKRRVEILFITFNKIELIMMERRSSRTIQLKVKYINIDNNLNHNTIYPILLTPMMHKKTLEKSRPFFVFLIEQTLGNEGVNEIKSLRVCCEPISLKIHDEIIIAIYEMFQTVARIRNGDSNFVDLVPIYRSYHQFTEWEEKELRKPAIDIFIREFEIARLSLEITFSIRPKLNVDNYIITTILSSFGVAISNVSEAKLTLSRFFKKDTVLTELIPELRYFYIKQFIKGIYKVLGSINLLGNPYVFIRLFAEGTWEIVNQPTEGFIEGPIQGTFGIVKGGVFFTRNLVAGTCNSFQAISESVSRGISYLTMDEKFIERREKIKIQKSEHLFKGLQYGGFAVYTGIEVAITGLVRHPMQGYQEKGIVGGATGVIKGLAGLITKPISGTFEGISKVSQGIKNTALLFQDGPNSKRMRPPRIFISELRYFNTYDYYESQAILILEHASTRYLNNYIDFVSIVKNVEETHILAMVLTDKFFSSVSITQEKIISQIEIADITTLTLDVDCLQIHLKSGKRILIGQRGYRELYKCIKKANCNLSQHQINMFE